MLFKVQVEDGQDIHNLKELIKDEKESILGEVGGRVDAVWIFLWFAERP